MPKLKPNSNLHQAMKKSCQENAFILNSFYRQTVLTSLIDTCRYKNWELFAAHVRSNHVHLVLRANNAPEKVLASLKAYATRYLRTHHAELFERTHFWSKHGSTEYIYEPAFLFPVLHYVIEEQGKKMALHYCDSYQRMKDEVVYY